MHRTMNHSVLFVWTTDVCVPVGYKPSHGDGFLQYLQHKVDLVHFNMFFLKMFKVQAL